MNSKIRTMNKAAGTIDPAMKMPSFTQSLPYSAAGVGLAALENKFIAPEIPEELKRVNLGIGGVTGYLLTSPDPKVRFAALASVPTKQLGLFGIGALDKFRRQQQSLVDANLGIANINRGTAQQQSSNAAQAGRIALMFLLPALAAGGAVGYMGYERWKKRNTKTPRYQTTGEKGRSRSGQKIKIDVPASALPSSFFESLINVDDNPRARTRMMQLTNGSAKEASAQPEQMSVPGLIGDLAWEATGIPGASRTMKDIGLGLGSYTGDRFGEAARYGGSAAGNAILTLLALRTGALPVAGRLMGQRFLQHQMQGIPGVPQRRFMPRLARTIHNWSYGPGYGTSVAKGGVNPALYSWVGSTSKNPIFQGLFTKRPGIARTIPSQAYNAARYGGNRLWNLAYRTKQLGVRHPILRAMALGIPLAGLGSQLDERRLDEARNSLAGWLPDWEKQRGPGGMPVSATLSGIMQALGSDNRAAVRNQMLGASWDPWASGR